VISSVLVANRGEIAVRIMRTCRRLGIRTVAIYSDADARALHVAEADAAVRVGPASALESYLNQSAILDAARVSKAEAIHPGYGFLAENADFAQACVDAGLVWVGPAPAAMRALGDKARAKALAAQVGVPQLAGQYGTEQWPAILAEYAQLIGFPLMIKASAGGGGRGMRVVETAEEFLGALEAARREAQASFGDSRVILERFLRRPRHIEVQIFGDQHGHLVHLGERECSIQRRHQKLVEETPSPAVDAELRSRMADAALRLAGAVGYSSAGTVEFLLDDDGSFAFLEVNARLQVEHPVTEAVTGLDLVELQLRVAAGEPLPFGQADVEFNGHAIEARVIAEDPLAGFLPSSGTIDRFWSPAEVRCDTWVQAGTLVSPYYDSLLAKVVAWAPTRAAAASGLASALRDMRLEGVRHNLDLLLAVVQHPAFLEGELHTTFLDEHEVVGELATVPPAVLAAASALDFLSAPSTPDPWQASSGWRLARVDQPAAWTRAARPHPATVTADLDGNGVHVTVQRHEGDNGLHSDVRKTPGGERLNVQPTASPRTDVSNPGSPQRDGSEAVPLHVRLLAATGGGWRRVAVDGGRVLVRELDQDHRIVEVDGLAYRLERYRSAGVDAAAAGGGSAGVAGRVTAPMPGRIASIAVQVGQTVSHNQPLVVLEAMKMEHVIEAPGAGVVTALRVQVGEQVTAGAELLTLDPAEQQPLQGGTA
jgi:3-methylcrotonyl-CoA carboxylase alpha subunit